ncbi:hypothetical protein B0H19DRAFT_60327 [Mycena capillaripes]|nr:hypothetical protein B0H19DRAFT_60327 [Mycena capillaripes]
MTEPVLSLPFVIPAEDTLVKFWKRIADLTTRTRSPAGQGWVCSTEVIIWNSRNPQVCEQGDQVRCRRRPGWMPAMSRRQKRLRS